MELGLKAGFTADEILFTPNMVGFAEFQRAVEYGVHITIDSIPMLELFGQAFGGKVPLFLRVNPHIIDVYKRQPFQRSCSKAIHRPY